MYEGSSRVPLYFAGPGIAKGEKFMNLTQHIDVLPTLMDYAGGEVPSWLSGESLKGVLSGDSNAQHVDFVTSQYHSNMGNTGSFMVRKGKWKYITFGHYLNAFKDYKAQLFDVDNDPLEIEDVSGANEDIVSEMDNMLTSLYNYEYIDCMAKRNDWQIFEEFFWNKMNETQLYKACTNVYDGFNQTDWQKILDWRTEMKTAPNCTSYGKMMLPNSPIA